MMYPDVKNTNERGPGIRVELQPIFVIFKLLFQCILLVDIEMN